MDGRTRSVQLYTDNRSPTWPYRHPPDLVFACSRLSISRRCSRLGNFSPKGRVVEECHVLWRTTRARWLGFPTHPLEGAITKMLQTRQRSQQQEQVPWQGRRPITLRGSCRWAPRLSDLYPLYTRCILYSFESVSGDVVIALGEVATE